MAKAVLRCQCKWDLQNCTVGLLLVSYLIAQPVRQGTFVAEDMFMEDFKFKRILYIRNIYQAEILLV